MRPMTHRNSGEALPRQLGSMLARTRLFAASYAPLALIFAARSIPSLLPVVIWVGIAFVGGLTGWLLANGTTKRGSWPVALSDVRDQGQAVAGYLATYLLPFLGGAPTRYEDILAYTIYFAVAWVVYINSDLALINPTLYLFGWRVVEASDGGRRVLVVCEDPPADGERVNVVRYLDVYVVKKVAQEGDPNGRHHTATRG